MAKYVSNGDKNSFNNLTVEQKFAKAMICLRSLRPFYSAVYEVMEKRESDQIPTLAVTANELLYNRKFVDSISFDGFLFVVLHEIAHIALKHVPRAENRNMKLWNVACDLYANATLAEEFKLTPGTTQVHDDISITMLPDCLFCSTIDLEKDCVENLYADIEKQAKANGLMDALMGKSSNSGSNNQGGSSSSNMSESSSRSDTSSGNSGESSSSSDTSSGNSGESNVSGESKGHDGREGNPFIDRYEFTIRGSKSTYDKYSDYKFSVDLDGLPSDLVNDGEDSNLADHKADKIISDALVRVSMSGKSCGNSTNSLEGIVTKMYKSELDWRKLLKKYLIAAKTTDSSFSRPDKRMFYQNMIYPGQVEDEENTIKGVKVCIDTSGSVSDEDLGYFCGQVYSLIKAYKIDAELVYWDTEVQSHGDFTDYKEFQRVKLYGRGGTDPSVVFNYFDTKECKVKPIVTLMFTDGYFSFNGISKKQCKKYKDTIWILTRHACEDFKPPFGKVAKAKFS